MEKENKEQPICPTASGVIPYFFKAAIVVSGLPSAASTPVLDLFKVVSILSHMIGFAQPLYVGSCPFGDRSSFTAASKTASVLT